MLVQIALYFSNSSSSYIQKYISLLFLYLSLYSTLNALTYPLILGIIKTNGLIVLSKYPIKYLESVCVSTNFEITILSTLTYQIFIGLFAAKDFSYTIS